MTLMNSAAMGSSTSGGRATTMDRGRQNRSMSDGQQQQQGASKPVNVGEDERTISVISGAIVSLMGLSRGSLPGLLVAGVGGALIYRGVSGHCHAYEAMGVSTAEEKTGQTEQDEILRRGVEIKQSFTINRPASELYGFWRNFENLPRIMTHLESVRTGDGNHSHWVAKAKGLGGKQFEWDAEMYEDVPNERIAWRSLPGSDIQNMGEVRFQKALGDRGTEVHVTISYVPPAGKLGHWIASMLGNNPKRVVREDVRNFKRIMELGEIPTIIGQPQGTCSGQGKYYTESEWKPLFT